MNDSTLFDLIIRADGRVISVTLKAPPRSEEAVVALVKRIVAAFIDVAERDMPGSGRWVEKSVSIVHDPAFHTVSLRQFYRSPDYPQRFENALRRLSDRILH